jgi:hypothetical protein
MGACGAVMTAARMSDTRLYVILERMLIQTLAALWTAAAIATPAAAPQAQAYQPKKARKHFVSITVDSQFVPPSDFGGHPLAELLGCSNTVSGPAASA